MKTRSCSEGKMKRRYGTEETEGRSEKDCARSRSSVTTDPGHETRIENFHLAVQRLVESTTFKVEEDCDSYYRCITESCVFTLFSINKRIPKRLGCLSLLQ